MQTGSDVLILVALPLVILFTLVTTWFPGVPKSNLLFLILAVSLSIVLLLSLLLNFFGSRIFFVTLEFPFHNNLFFYVTTKVQFFFSSNLVSHKRAKHVELDTTFFVNLLLLANFALSTYPYTYRLLISTPKLYLSLFFNFFAPSSTSIPIRCLTSGGEDVEDHLP